MPVPPPVLPSATGPVFAESECGVDIVLFYVEAVEIVQIAIPGFGDDGERPRLSERSMLQAPTRIIESRN